MSRPRLLAASAAGFLGMVAAGLLPPAALPDAARGVLLAASAVVFAGSAAGGLWLPPSARQRPAEASQPGVCVCDRRPPVWNETVSGYGPTPEYLRLLAEGRARYRRDAARFAPFPPAGDNVPPTPDAAFDAFAAEHQELRP